jgi:hypothetical protein
MPVNITCLHSYFDDELNLCVNIVKIADSYKTIYELDYTTRDGDYVDSEEIEYDDLKQLLKN